MTLSIKNKESLYKAAKMLDSKGIKYHMFFEPDNEMGHSTITTEPLSKEQSKALSKFKLWKLEDAIAQQAQKNLP